MTVIEKRERANIATVSPVRNFFAMGYVTAARATGRPFPPRRSIAKRRIGEVLNTATRIAPTTRRKPGGKRRKKRREKPAREYAIRKPTTREAPVPNPIARRGTLATRYAPRDSSGPTPAVRALYAPAITSAPNAAWIP